MAGAGVTVTAAEMGRSPNPVGKILIDEVNNVVTDLETLRVAVSAGGVTLANELRDDHATFKTWAEEVDADENNIANHLDSLLTPDGVIGGSYSFSAGAATTLTGAGFVSYRISGKEYHGPVGNVTLEDLGDVTQNNFSAWRIEIDALGALTAKASPTVGGYATAQIALLALSGLAPTANSCTLGYLTLTDSDSVFNIGTDNLNASGVTAVIYYERGPRKRISGLNAALGAASTLTAASTTYGHGTINANVNGLKKAQIAAGATQALTDADTIPTLNFGAVLICTDLAGTGKVSINSAGTPGVTSMAHASAAAALTAINLVVDRLPAMFVPFALIRVNNAAGGTFTFKTTNWDAASVTSTITDATLAGWDRTIATGFDSHQINRVAIPADITAPIPATLAAAAASTTAVDAAADMLASTITITAS